jgi:hypothetical protein
VEKERDIKQARLYISCSENYHVAILLPKISVVDNHHPKKQHYVFFTPLKIGHTYWLNFIAYS